MRGSKLWSVQPQTVLVTRHGEEQVAGEDGCRKAHRKMDDSRLQNPGYRTPQSTFTAERGMGHHNLMVDIETLDDKNTAAILSIGAVVFDPESAHVEDRRFHANVDVEDALRYGTYSESTVEFWERQPAHVTATLFDPEPTGLEDALKAFDKYIDSWSPKPKWIWANSPTFDIAILRYAYAKFDRKFPYIFWKEMDVRTLKNLIPKEARPIMEGAAHSAVDDCVHQCKFVQLFHGVEF